MTGAEMKLNDPDAYRVATELDVMRENLVLRDQRILELGCGAAWMTRLLMEHFQHAELVATEVDRIQHRKNLAIDDLPCVDFRYGGAEAIDAADGSFDAVFMFKSLHHVPAQLMDQALGEIHRVLKPGGLAYFSEPVYWGDFNTLMSLFNDEQVVRQQAFDALCGAVRRGDFESRAEVFFQVPGTYESWEIFDRRFIQVTHTEHRLSPEQYQRVKDAFMAHMTPEGAYFLKPQRVDILSRA
jgi:SAM-dependent methyltransferase